jgi:hypothetical protein
MSNGTIVMHKFEMCPHNAEIVGTPSNGVMSSTFLHKTIFFSESFSGDLMLYVAIKLNLKSS